MYRSFPSLFILLAALSGCTTKEERSAALEVDLTDKPVSETWDARMHASTGGTPTHRISAPYVAEYSRGDSTVLELGPDPLGGGDGRVTIDLYSSDGVLEATVESDRASYVETSEWFSSRGNVHVVLHGEKPTEVDARRLEAREGVVSLSGSVRLQTETGETLTTELLRFDREAQRLYAPGRFEVRTPTEWVRGTALDARADLSRYTFSNASGELEVHE